MTEVTKVFVTEVASYVLFFIRIKDFSGKTIERNWHACCRKRELTKSFWLFIKMLPSIILCAMEIQLFLELALSFKKLFLSLIEGANVLFLTSMMLYKCLGLFIESKMVLKNKEYKEVSITIGYLQWTGIKKNSVNKTACHLIGLPSPLPWNSWSQIN